MIKYWFSYLRLYCDLSVQTHIAHKYAGFGDGNNAYGDGDGNLEPIKIMRTTYGAAKMKFSKLPVYIIAFSILVPATLLSYFTTLLFRIGFWFLGPEYLKSKGIELE